MCARPVKGASTANPGLYYSQSLGLLAQGELSLARPDGPVTKEACEQTTRYTDSLGYPGLDVLCHR
ncbi:hypothetical protein GCM10023318_41120 [Nocardia callitridis]|uniref:Uncharacterized protein n=1 Tax=Nocardia callitridis TaxID=648753 RepID=A0ABP9KK15_9NOCA